MAERLGPAFSLVSTWSSPLGCFSIRESILASDFEMPQIEASWPDQVTPSAFYL